MSPVRRANSPNGTWSQRVEEVKDGVAQAPQQLSACVEERPMSSLLAAFGVGVVAGAGFVALYYSAQPSHDETTYENYSRRISDALRDVMPQSLKR